MSNVGKYSHSFTRFASAALLAALIALVLNAAAPLMNKAFPAQDERCYATQAFAEDNMRIPVAYTESGLPLTSMAIARNTYPITKAFTHADSLDRGDVYLIIYEGWDWRDVSESRTPSLYELLYANASANMVEFYPLEWDEIRNDPSLHTLVLTGGSPSDLDEVIRRVVIALRTGDSLVVTNSPSFLGEIPKEQKYSSLIIQDASDRGLFTSTTTNHMGLISTDDGIAALRALMTATQRFPANLTIYPFTELMPTSTRLDFLVHAATSAAALQESQPAFTLIFVALLLIALAISAALLFLEMRLRPTLLAYLLPAARILWILVLSIPLASYIMVLQLPTVPDAEICLDYFGFVTMEISFVCIIIALVFRWTWAYLALLVVTVVTLIVDQLLGGPLSCGSYLSYAPLDGVRFFGMGNEGAALLFSAWVVLVSFYLTRRPFSRLAQVLRKWLYPLLSILVLFVIASPWFGANFGAIIWGMVGIYVSWRRFNAHRLHKREVIGAVLVAGAMALFVLVMDTTFNVDSHMGGPINVFSPAFFDKVVSMFQDVLEFSLATLTYSPIMTILFVALMGFLLFLDIRKPGPYAKFWADHSEFHGAFNALLIVAVIMLLIEDSGILMPALLLLYPLSSLVWFICNYHSWHIRSFIKVISALER